MLIKTSFCCFGFCAVFIFSACGPLVPLSYVNGKTDNSLTQTIETSEATVWLQYIQSQHRYYIFDLEIVNHSENPINFAPQFISFYASPKAFTSPKEDEDVHIQSSSNSALLLKRNYANSPATTERIYYNKIKEKRSAAVLFAVIGVGIILYDIAKDSEDSQKETWTKKDHTKSIGRDLAVAAAVTASDIANASAEEAVHESQYVPYELFPECSIQPNKHVRGKIFIPMESTYRYSRVVVPIGDTDYVFDFKRRGN